MAILGYTHTRPVAGDACLIARSRKLVDRDASTVSLNRGFDGKLAPEKYTYPKAISPGRTVYGFRP